MRLFCPECGSSIAEAPSTRPGMLILNAGTLDDPTSVTPQFEIYCDRALSWVQLSGEMRRFPKDAGVAQSFGKPCYRTTRIRQ